MMRLVLVCMVGHTPLRPSRPVHWPPSIGSRSKIVGSNPCDSSQRAAISPPGPAPITATLLVISGTVAHRGLQKGRKPACASGRRRRSSSVQRLADCAVPQECPTYGWRRGLASRNRHRDREHKGGSGLFPSLDVGRTPSHGYQGHVVVEHKAPIFGDHRG